MKKPAKPAINSFDLPEPVTGYDRVLHHKQTQFSSLLFRGDQTQSSSRCCAQAKEGQSLSTAFYTEHSTEITKLKGLHRRSCSCLITWKGVQRSVGQTARHCIATTCVCWEGCNQFRRKSVLRCTN